MRDPGDESLNPETEGIPQTDDRTAVDEELSLPRDFTQGAEEYGTTLEEQLTDEPLTPRLRREVPDEQPQPGMASEQPEPGAAPEGQLFEPESEVDQVDTIAEVEALEDPTDELPLSAEEAAIRLEE